MNILGRLGLVVISLLVVFILGKLYRTNRFW